MGLKIRGFAHVALRTKNFEKMDDFYQHVMGFPRAFSVKEESGRDRLVCYRLPGGQFLELFPEDTDFRKEMDNQYTGSNERTKRSHYHCCLEIDARHQVYRLLESKGAGIRYNADDSVGMCGSWCSFIEDPENNQWELMEFSPISKQLDGDPMDMRFHDDEEA